MRFLARRRGVGGLGGGRTRGLGGGRTRGLGGGRTRGLGGGRTRGLEGVEREDSKGSKGGASASTGGLEGKPSGFNFLTHFSICHSTFNMSLISRYRIARGASEIGGKGERGTRRGREREGVRDRRVSQKGDLRTYEEKVLQIS